MTNDLISREVALEAIHNLQTAFGWGNGLHEMDIHKVLLKIPAVDAAPLVHGRWIKHCACVECSVCGYNCWADSAPTYDYCPYCGAKMDAGDDTNA